VVADYSLNTGKFSLLAGRNNNTMALNETVPVKNALSRMCSSYGYKLQVVVLKQDFQLVQLHLKPSNYSMVF